MHEIKHLYIERIPLSVSIIKRTALYSHFRGSFKCIDDDESFC